LKILANARDELNAQQRVATQLEKVIVNAQALQPEQLFPERSHRRFDFILRRRIIAIRFRARPRDSCCPLRLQLVEQTYTGCLLLLVDERLEILCRDDDLRLRAGKETAEKLDTFIQLIKKYLPENTGVVLRGSAVTGFRWKDKAPFDADGPGTSDLDLTLVGHRVLEYYKITGFFVPGVHSRPLSDEDPDIAPDLVPLREQLMAMVKRPVNIQGTRDWVMYFREHVMGQPYLTLCGKIESA